MRSVVELNGLHKSNFSTRVTHSIKVSKKKQKSYSSYRDRAPDEVEQSTTS